MRIAGSKENLILGSTALVAGALGFYKGIQKGKEIANREFSETSLLAGGLTGVRSVTKYTVALLASTASAVAGLSLAKASVFALNYFTKK